MTRDTPKKRLILNGEADDYAVESLAELLSQFGITASKKGVAIAYNGEVANRNEWQNISLKNGDSIEILRPIQGG